MKEGMKPIPRGSAESRPMDRIRVAAVLACAPMAAATLSFAGTTDRYRATMMLFLVPFLLVAWSGWAKLPLWRPNRFLRALAIVGVAALVTASLSTDPHWPAAVLRTVEWIAWVLFAGGIARLWLVKDDLVKWLLLGSVPFAFLLASFLIAVRFLALDDPDSYPWRLATPGYFHLRNLGLLAPLALVVLAGAFIRFRAEPVTAAWRKRSVWLLGAASTVAWATLFWSGSRAGVVGGMIALGLLWVAAPAIHRRGLLAFAGVTFAIGALISIPFVPDQPGMGIWRIAKDTVDVSGGANELASGRLTIWNDTWERLLEHPLQGIGPDQYQYQPNLPARVFEPHNAYLLAWMEGGILGLIALLGLLLVLAVAAWRRSRDSSADAVCLGALGALAALGMVDSVTYWTVVMLAASLFAGAICAGAARGGTVGDRSTQVPQRNHPSPLALGLTGLVLVTFGLARWQISTLAGPAPEPSGVTAQSLRAFPSSLWGIENWLQEWEQTGAAADLDEWYRWLIRVSPAPYHHRVQYGFYRARQGDAEGAIALVEAGLSETPANMRTSLEKRYEEILAELRRRAAN